MPGVRSGGLLVPFAVLCCVVALSGTALAGAAGRSSTAHGASRSAQAIRYVSLGDSVTSVTPSFVDALAKRAGVVLHRKVVVTRVVEEDTVAHLVSLIASAAALRSADLVTITLGANEIGAAADAMTPGGCGSTDGSACVSKAETAYEKSYAALLSKLTKLRPTSKTAYRLLTSYNTPGVFPAAKGAAFTAALLAENRFVCAQASKRGMKCVDVFAVFNGADGSRDPNVTGLTVPDGHPSAKGSAAIAKAVMASGFAPLH